MTKNISKLCPDCGAPLGPGHACVDKPSDYQQPAEDPDSSPEGQWPPVSVDEALNRASLGQLEDQAGAAQKEAGAHMVRIKETEALSALVYSLADQFHDTSKVVFSLAQDLPDTLPEDLRMLSERTAGFVDIHLPRIKELHEYLTKKEGQDDDDKKKTGSAGIAENPE